MGSPASLLPHWVQLQRVPASPAEAHQHVLRWVQAQPCMKQLAKHSVVSLNAVHAQVIAELDEKKREALEKTWIKVNAEFGSIFSTLLPGTSAKLEPPEGQSFLAGGHRIMRPFNAPHGRCLHE